MLSLKNGESYIHGLISIDDYLYALTNTPPTRLVKIKGKTLSASETLTFPNDGKHDFGADLIYVKTKKSIYIVFQGTEGMYLSSVNPDTLIYSDVNLFNTGINGSAPAITADENYLYILTTTKPSVIYKISLSDFKQFTSVELTRLNFGHSIQFDGSNLYATGVDSPSWIAKIDPITLEYTSQHFLIGENYATDDTTITKDYVFVCLETKNGTVLRINKNSLSSIERINTGIGAKCFGAFFYRDFIWTLFDTSLGKLVRIDPLSLKIKEYNIEEDSPSELVSINQDLFIANWMSPAKIAKITINDEATLFKSFFSFIKFIY